MMSTKLMLYKHKTYTNGKHPVILQVMFNRKRKKISLGYQVSAQDWYTEKSRFRRTVDNYEEKNLSLKRYELLAQKIIDESILSGKPISLTEFAWKLTGKQTNTTDFFAFCEELLREMKTAGKIGNKSVYTNVRNSLKLFVGGPLHFEDINVTFLNKYEVWLASEKYDRKGCAGSTMNQYMRTLCAIFNKAISRDLIPHTSYPFRNQFNPKGYSYSHLKSEPNHRALSPEELEKFKNFDFQKYPHLANAYNYFMFMYYCRGINWTDFCHLKHTDIKDDRIQYKRQKTGKLFNVRLSAPLRDIIKRYDYTPYVFPVLSDFHKSPTQKANRIRKCIRQTNRDLKEIAMRLDITPDLSTYTARHTYAMSLKRGGIGLSLISDALGHADSKVTRHYLARFGNGLIDATDEVL